MNILNRVGKRLGNTAKTVTKKSEELVEITKINISIGNEKDKIKKLLSEIGNEVYEKYVKGESFGESLDDKCAQVKAIEDNIEMLRKKVKDMKGKDNNTESSEEVKCEAKEQPEIGNEQESQ